MGAVKTFSILLALLLLCFIVGSIPPATPEPSFIILHPVSAPPQFNSNTPSLNNTKSETPNMTYTGTNLLGVIDSTIPPSKWWIDRTGQVIDAAVYYSSAPSVRLDATTPESNNPDRECDSISLSIEPGDHLVFQCWIKTSATGTSYLWGGARIGIDFYDSNRITAIQYNPEGATPSEYEMNNQVDQWHDWGTDWALMTIDMIVPEYMPSDGYYYPDEQLRTPSGIIAWMQVWDSNGPTNPGQAWFSDPTFYVNPSEVGGVSVPVLVSCLLMQRR